MASADMKRWHEDAANFGWKMPEAPLWKRLPVIRHVRTWWNAYQISRWYSSGPGMFGIRSGYDSWVLFGIWHGFERPAQEGGGE